MVSERAMFQGFSSSGGQGHADARTTRLYDRRQQKATRTPWRGFRFEQKGKTVIATDISKEEEQFINVYADSVRKAFDRYFTAAASKTEKR